MDVFKKFMDDILLMESKLHYVIICNPMHVEKLEEWKATSEVGHLYSIAPNPYVETHRMYAVRADLLTPPFGTNDGAEVREQGGSGEPRGIVP